ncbi:MAG TPA: COX15/CtaA family protein [Acidimicrobiales bacterium]|nr:COX15/CtaA family protein [Acidimicrobiales bacterium]
MAVPRLSPQAYRRATLAALVLLSVIVVTGAAVRLTGSGLGCTDWPACENDRLVAPLEYHPMIEFANRMFTGAVVVAIVVAVLGSLVRTPRRRDLTWLSLGLVAGVVGQIVLGGITVLFELHPALVGGHFLLSMVLVTNAVVLHWRAGRDHKPIRVVAPASGERWLANAVAIAAAVVLVAGTVVTGTGPHGGDEEARRYAFEMPDVARVHGAAVWVLVALTLVAALRFRRSSASPDAARAATTLLAIEIAQGAIGYAQYFNGVPPLLVALHVIGALGVWIGAVRLRLSIGSSSAVELEPRPPGEAADPREPSLVHT